MNGEGLIIRELELNDIKENLLDNYSRYQEINKAWCIENNKKIIKDMNMIEDWNYDAIQKVIKELKDNIMNHGKVFAAYIENKLIGFASLSGVLYGENNQYLKLSKIQVSNDCRGKGIGKKLFDCCIDEAKRHGAKKIYISGNPAVETQGFYKSIGCVDATWIDRRQVELEPYDCQLEYVL
ncbi:GNAT family N-acetyltransferase [Vallitalea longa]|nr:GNAT family N-acetyltransferase [Vallitalea longa]